MTFATPTLVWKGPTAFSLVALLGVGFNTWLYFYWIGEFQLVLDDWLRNKKGTTALYKVRRAADLVSLARDLRKYCHPSREDNVKKEGPAKVKTKNGSDAKQK